jgi:hypothetical protein
MFTLTVTVPPAATVKGEGVLPFTAGYEEAVAQ